MMLCHQFEKIMLLHAVCHNADTSAKNASSCAVMSGFMAGAAPGSVVGIKSCVFRKSFLRCSSRLLMATFSISVLNGLVI